MNPNKSNIFSKEKNKYVAFGCIELKFIFNKNPLPLLPEVLLLHIPIVKEDDDLYYSLCCEWNDVTYGSTIQKSFDRMTKNVTLTVEENLTNKNLASLFREEEKMQDYKNIFNTIRDDWNIKMNVNEKKAKKIDDYLKEENNGIKTTREKTEKINFVLGDVTISSKYLEEIAA